MPPFFSFPVSLLIVQPDAQLSDLAQTIKAGSSLRQGKFPAEKSAFIRDTFHSLGDFHREGHNLGSYIIEAWLSGLGIMSDTVADPERYTSLVHFPEHPLYYLIRDADSQAIYRALQPRLEYIAKHYSKPYCRAVRSVGYSTC